VDGRVYFCQPCDSTHEGEALWADWSQKSLHWGIQELHIQERVATQLRNRLCEMLFRETNQAGLLRISFEEAVCLSGLTAREVLERLRRFEALHGRHRGRPRFWTDDQSRKRDWESRRNKRAVGKG
jgi:hypothetical protein